MTDPLTIKTAITIVSSCISILKEITDDTSNRMLNLEHAIRHLSNRIDVEIAKIDSLAEKTDDALSRELGASFRSILDAAGSKHEIEMMNLLHFSYQGFTRLSCINPNGTTQIQGKTLKNSLIASLGFYGRHLYFALLGRYNDSLRQVYECILKYPEEGISVFDSKFFSRDYRQALIEYDKKLVFHKIGDSDTEHYAALSDPRFLLVFGKADVGGLDLDEEGVILSFEREDLIIDLTNECNITLNALKGDI